MNFFEALWQEALIAKTPYLLLLVLLALFLSRAVNVKARFRGVLFFTAIHLVLLLVGTALRANGSLLADDFRIPAWVFSAVAEVNERAART